MDSLSPQDISMLLLGLAVMLGVARFFGELANYFRQPAIVGEIVAGIILGPTLFGALFPDISSALFPSTGAAPLAFETINLIAVVLLLLIAGLEVDLSVLWRQGRAALLVSLLGVVVPFILGFGLAYLAPAFWGMMPGGNAVTFALFLGTALSISALPVAARILMDLGIFKSDVGMLIMAAAMFNDLIGWIIFSIVLSMMGTAGGPTGGSAAISHGSFGVWATIILTLCLVVFALTILRSVVHKVLPWIQARLSWPGGVLSFTLVLAFMGASLTEAIGIHAIFGAFLVGIAIGDSKHLREHTRAILHQFVTNIFAPIFFVSIGLRVNFFADFNVVLVVAVVLVSVAGKTAGTLLAARLGRLPKPDRYTVTAGMNAHGAMEIILGLLALEYGIITEQMFVALVALALIGAMGSGPVMSLFIVRPKRWALEDLIVSDLYVPALKAGTRDEAISELAYVAASAVALSPVVIMDAVLARESLMGTGLGEEIAVPHARLSGLDRPLLVVGHSREGIDFDSPDGLPARLIFLLLTPRQDNAAQVQIIGQIARFFRRPEARQLVYEGEHVDVIRASVKIEQPKPHGAGND